MERTQDTNTYAFEGYPVEDVKRRYGKDPYRLQDYELQAINDVRQCMENGTYEESPENVEESILYLQSLIKKLSLIGAAEQNEGVINTELRRKIEEIKAVYDRLMKMLQMHSEQESIMSNRGMKNMQTKNL